MGSEFAELKIRNKLYKLPIRNATMGPDVIDVTKLYSEAGYFTYDPGFMSTASCSSTITYINGEQGILKHRGYDVKFLAENKSFLEVAHLLLNAELPTKSEYQKFCEEIHDHSLINEQTRNIFGAFRHSAHPMAVILSVVGSLSAFYYESINTNTTEGRQLDTIRIIAKMPTIAAMAYKYSQSQAFVYPHPDLDFIENFLYMMFSAPSKHYKVNPILVKALNKIFILHADHEQNASTSTVRMAGSSGPNAFACVSAAIASLWGAAHGGANEAVLNMLKKIGNIDQIPEYIEKVKDKNNHFRLMGFGHRVYKNHDPRAEVLKETCKEVLSELGQLKQNSLLEVAMELEKIALNDQYFIDRKLYPNVDFYSGIIYEAMGIPSQMFTALFAVARTVGWMSHWKEMWEDPENKIARPRQLYMGQKSR
ncbi:MAG: citrate synthase [Rickettsiaceae bacterium]|nr:citrate synthase [Rickettsiaceae bacterium]